MTSAAPRSIRPRGTASRRRWGSTPRSLWPPIPRCSTRPSSDPGHVHRGPSRATSFASPTQRFFRGPRGSPAVFVTHELLRRGAVEERAYQVNIARACLERSTLVVLPTGMGKTVIAAMVIAEVLRRRGGRILFLAPTKPLVEQHAASMRKVLVVDRITLFTGEATAPEDRELLWRENKIIVSTPQVIRNDVRAERISLDDVSLIVFDEAHRAVGDYAYVDVAAAYKEVPDRLVLGMTASPGSSAEKILEVCGNLGITAVEIRPKNDRAGDRDEGGPRHRTRGDTGARIPPVVFREHAEGHQDEGGHPVPEAREDPRGHPARGGDGGRAPEAREDRLDRPKATDGKGGLQ